MSPARVVAPTRVNRGRSRRIERADGPLPITMSSWKSSIAGYSTSSTARGQPVDLVDEEHVAVVEVGEDRREVAGALERRTARDPQVRVHLGGDDARERRLAGPRRAREQQMVDGLAALLRREQEDLEMLGQARLADELVEVARPQRRLLGRLHRIGARAAAALPSRVTLAHAFTARRRRASRRRSSTAPSAGRSARTARTSSASTRAR